MITFELIKNRIQQYKLSSLVHNILEVLNVIQRNKQKIYPVWQLFVLLKWSYLHTKDSILRKNIQPYELEYLLQLIEKFGGQHNGISFKTTQKTARSLKIIAYQQFWCQDVFHNSALSRQLVLYLQLRSKFDIDKEFLQLTGIKLKSFLEYCYFTFFFFHFDTLDNNDKRYEGYLFNSYFTLFKSKWPEEELIKFLDLLTIKNPADFEKLHKLKDECFQLYETNFFITKPLIFFRNQYRVPHRTVFVQTLKHFVYDYLKMNSERFPEEFGKRLEKYIELGLKEAGLTFLNEKQLKSQYKLGSVSDFLVDENILIESKAIELHPRSGVLRSFDILTNDLDKTIIKAYSQLLSTAATINPEKEWFGIIITYKEMYLGFGKDAWEDFLKDSISEFSKNNNISVSILPPDNICFISIDDWDYIVQIIKDRKASLKEILMTGRDMNASPDQAESILLVEQLIHKQFKAVTFNHSYLEQAYSTVDIL